MIIKKVPSPAIIPIYRHASTIHRKFPRPTQITLRWNTTIGRTPSPPEKPLSQPGKPAPTPPVSIRRLANGATLVLQKILPCRNTATVGVWLKFGSRLPDEDSEGLVHFMEHMTFKGTRWRDSRDIEKWIENHGGHLNAYTSKDHVA